MSTTMLWGYGIDDYKHMFDLSQADLDKPILEFASGPSAFNVEQTAKGREVTSSCPLFNLDKSTLSVKAHLIFDEKVRQLKNKDEALIKRREAGINAFLADYPKGHKQGRYLAINEKQLPFDDFAFHLALSAHYFFTDLDEQSTPFHIDMIKELARVAEEVRLFPLVGEDGHMSAQVGPVLLGLQQAGYGAEVRHVDDNAMLRVWAQTCHTRRPAA